MKLSAGVSRILAAIFAILAFNLAITGIFAQEEPARDEVVTVQPAPAVDPEEDPITTAERALTLGDAPAGGAVQPTPAASALSIFRVLLTLAVVAAAVYGIVFFIKRLRRGGSEQDPFLKVLASTPLGANRSAYVIAVGSRAWLVGAAEHGVNLISEIEDKEVLDTMFLEDSRRGAEAPSGRFPDFRALLQRLGGAGESGAPSSPENIRKRRERLKGL